MITRFKQIWTLHHNPNIQAICTGVLDAFYDSDPDWIAINNEYIDIPAPIYRISNNIRV